MALEADEIGQLSQVERAHFTVALRVGGPVTLRGSSFRGWRSFHGKRSIIISQTGVRRQGSRTSGQLEFEQGATREWSNATGRSASFYSAVCGVAKAMSVTSWNVCLNNP